MIDYIFYRVYWAYNKKRESAKFLSPLYMAMVFAFLFFPFALFLCELLRDSYHRNDGYLLSIYLLMILIYSYLRFFPNKKIWLINKKFEGNGYNYKIPDWCFFVVLPLSIVWGIITYSLLVKFFIKPFALRGIILYIICCKRSIKNAIKDLYTNISFLYITIKRQFGVERSANAKNYTNKTFL